jgi:acetolactate decarboxylase
MRYWKDGDSMVATLKEKGDFGIGTFNNLDGEMVALNGRFWQLDLDGYTHEAADTLTLPQTPDYLTASFTRDAAADLEKAEKQYVFAFRRHAVQRFRL